MDNPVIFKIDLLKFLNKDAIINEKFHDFIQEELEEEGISNINNEYSFNPFIEVKIPFNVIYNQKVEIFADNAKDKALEGIKQLLKDNPEDDRNLVLKMINQLISKLDKIMDVE